MEQPIPRDRLAGPVEIRRGIGIPLMADQSVTDPASLIDIVRRGAADLVKVKLMKQGDFLRTQSMIECAAAGLRVVIGHGFRLTPSTLAEAAPAAVNEAVIDGCEAVGAPQDGGRRGGRARMSRHRHPSPLRRARPSAPPSTATPSSGTGPLS